ncbi:DUF2076 domain-containing protein [Biostraticola tofi]|uniref:DUF2076 family protein n=1 Tax=Biostraticola tofi TaxID=466109 RepID=A0A4R3YRP7_9GAMM|nr:DUF2076 family protein [Biostraticola tofi]TCV94338.1 hypothetical protein EDC52_10779 [Biostraticola tofi]
MQPQEQRLIEGLFQRLNTAEQQSGQRDDHAEQKIQQSLRLQPTAPYYMVQSILVQEAALTRLSQQVKQLEDDKARLQSEAQSRSSGFLSGLFGGGTSADPKRTLPASQSPAQPAPPTAVNPGGSSLPPSGGSRAGGFLSGALQTAAGVAGGVMLANMLTGMFDSSKPEEIGNIIEQPDQATDNFSATDFQNDPLNTFDDTSDIHFDELNNGGLSHTDGDFSDDNDDFIADDDYS